MTSQEVTVEVREEDGSIGTATRTLYATRYGPVLTSILGLPLFPWTSATAYALGDANHHMRYLNQFFLWNHAQSVDELFDVQKEYLSVPWVNTVAADRAGNALYSDVSVVPNVPDDKATMCSGALGLVTFAALGLPTLDGSRTECGWDTDEDAVVPGIFGPSNLPHLLRSDWVANSNDSYWLSHPDQPLTGFARIVGDEETPRTLRTRLGIVMALERLSGQDEYGGQTPGDVMTQDVLQDVVFNNRQHAAELVRDDLVALCASLPGGQALRSEGEPVDVGDACQILADWDMRDDLDSPGAILFRRFWSNLTSSPVPIDVSGAITGELPSELVDLLPVSLVTPIGAPWSVPFDVNDPVNTPRDLDTDNPRVQEALGNAIADLQAAGIPLDGLLRNWQYVTRLGERIPIHGGPGALGVFNALNSVWRGDPDAGAVGYPELQHGSSFVMAAHFVDPALNDGCPVDADAIVTYSQSEDETRPFFADQTRMYAEKEWNPMYYCESDLAADPGLTIIEVTNGAPADEDDAPPLPTTGGGLALLGLGVLLLLSGSRRTRAA